LRTACSRGAKKVDHERHATIIREAVQPLTGSAQDYDSLLALIGDARFVLLGEASHGTHEF
jgi:erythromycin esterase-like protein